MLKSRPERLTTKQKQSLTVLMLLLVVFGAAIYYGKIFHNKEIDKYSEEVVVDTDLIQRGLVLAESLPVRLRIPRLNIDTGFEEPLGLYEDGTAEVPESNTEVGWYKYGPTPGEIGPAVIFGHVDSYTGPAVFFYLGQLNEGDEIIIDREDGTQARFIVTKLERYQQSDFPTTLVYGDIDHAGLRLITCSGLYNRGVGEYTHNLVVYAKLAL